MPAGDTPYLRLRVNDYPLPPAVQSEIQEIRLTHTDDGADELELQVNASSIDGFVGAGGVALQAGNQVTVESGYGVVEVHHGRFEVVRHELRLDRGATLRVFAYDAMHKMVGPHSKQGRVFMYVQRDSNIAREYAAWYGFEADVEETPDNPLFERKSHGGHKPKKSKEPPSVMVYPSWVKEVGTTDLEDLKVIARRNGYLPPRVRWQDGVDWLIFRRPSSLEEQIAAQPQSKGLLVWRYGPRSAALAGSSGDCTLRRFDPQYSTSQQPLAVRVVGHDEAGVPVVVEVEVQPGEAPRIVYQGVAHDPFQHESPQGAAGQAWLQAQKDGAFSDSAGLLVQVLGQYQPTKGVKTTKKVVRTGDKIVGDVATGKGQVLIDTEPTTEQWWAREVLAMDLVHSELAAREYAERWIATRRQGFQRSTFEFLQIPTTDWIDTGQIYPVVGVPPEYEGFWLVREVTQSWRGGVHRAAGVVQRVPSERPLSEVFV